MGTLTTGKIKAGALESSDSPASNTYVSFANSTVTQYESTAYVAGGQEIETFDFTENGLSTGEAFVYEKSGAGKLQGYPGFCLVSDQKNGSQVFVDRGPGKNSITYGGDTHHDSGGSIYLHNPTAIYFDGTTDYLTIPVGGPDFDFSGACTFEYYANLTSLGAQQGLLEIGSDANDGSRLLCFHNSTGFKSHRNADSGAGDWDLDTGLTGITAGKWHHVALTRDSGNLIRFFLDGKIKASVIVSGNMGFPGTTRVMTFGAQYNNSGGREEYLTGYMDDIRVLNGIALYTKDFIPPSRSPIDTRVYGGIADYTKITMMGYRSDTSSYFTAINYVAGDEVVARDYMGIGHDDLKSVAYSESTQQIMVHNHTTNTVKFTAYVEATT